MRDYRGLEEITDAVSRGLLLGDVIVAIDRVLAREARDEEAMSALRDGASFLRDMAHPDRAATLASTTGSLSATGAAVDAAARAIGRKPPRDAREYLEGLAEAVGAVAAGAEPQGDDLQQVVALFSFLGDVELARASVVARQPQDPVRWLGTRTPSLSS